MSDRIRQAVIAYLKGNAGVQAILGQRIYSLKLPDNLTNWPAATIQRVSTVRHHTKLGPAGLTDSRIQVSIFGPDFLAVTQAADAVRAALDGFRGDMGGVTVHNVRSDGEIDLYDPDAGMDGTYHVALEFVITHEG
ncbi:MAG TPA: DUF3168 domain-containing protein [Calditerricola sp.]